MIKKIFTIVVGVIFSASVLYSGYSLFEKQRLKYQTQGYNTALQQMVDAATKERQVTISSGSKSIKLIYIPDSPPTGSQPTNK